MMLKGVPVDVDFDVTLALMCDRLKQPPSVLLREPAHLLLRVWNIICAVEEESRSKE